MPDVCLLQLTFPMCVFMATKPSIELTLICLSGAFAANLASSTLWQPRGVLVAHLAEHRRAVNRIAVSHNGAFFVTASNDETCKIWDSRRLEKDISFRSKLTYASQVRIADP